MNILLYTDAVGFMASTALLFLYVVIIVYVLYPMEAQSSHTFIYLMFSHDNQLI